MKLYRYLLPVVLAIWSTSPALFASCDCNFLQLSDELDERDYEAVTEYINTKRTIELEEKDCNLTISGDIRFEWASIVEVVDGIRLTGRGARTCDGIPRSRNDFDIDLNLYFDYKCERAWGVAHLEFDNPAGVQESRKICGTPPPVYNPCGIIDSSAPFGSGRCDALCLRKAYMGYNICADGCSRFDVEIGRRRLYDVFDSRIQFLARFDGIVFRYATQWCDTDIYWNLGGFIVDERVNHFAWVTEVGFLNIYDSGVDLKYSFIDWRKNGKNRCLISDPDSWRTMNSQWTFAYHFDPDLMCTEGKLYGAFLWNHNPARNRPYLDNRLNNLGWYAGFIIGEVAQEGDWSIDINYQYVEVQAVSDADASGIGRGNSRNETRTMAKPYNDPANTRGNTNWKGFKIEGLYALTDNLSIDAQFQYSKAEDKIIGGPMTYNRFKIEAIYAF